MPQSLPDFSGTPQAGIPVLLSGEVEMRTANPLNERVRYAVTSHVRYTMQAAPDAELALDDWLILPAGVNPRALAEGRGLQALPDPGERVLAVLRRFHNENYVYTLQPPLFTGRDSIDDFLYGSRAGFCEHYAGAFVFLMRAAGVPARVVTGYQGGEMNPLDGYLTVRQSDAHAWAEVWLPNRGWVRVDPTAAVAPERVQRSMTHARRPPPFGLPGLGRLVRPADPDSAAAQVRYAFGAVNNGWNQWVLNYSANKQRATVDRIERGLLRWRTLAALAVAALVLLGSRTWWRRRQSDPVDRLYSALCQRLAQRGLPRAPDEAPAAYAGRVAGAKLAPEARAAAAEFLHRYSAWRYAPQADAGAATTLKALLARVR
jgi:transglutaminase-like putative cysteine protease